MNWLKENWFKIGIIILGIITIVVYFYFSITYQKTLPPSEVFNDIAVGLGALLAGLGGLIAFVDWSKKSIRKKEFRKFKTAHPREKLKTVDTEHGTSDLLRNPGNGRIYVYDSVVKKRFWIEDMGTYYELGYHDDSGHRDWRDWTPEDIEKYKDYEQGNNILDS